MNFSQKLQDKTAEMEDILKRFLPKEEGCQKTVLEAMNYSLMAGGKRLRPMLMLETYHLFGGQDRALIEPFMAAIEMIHTYSLVHDDLPAMDNDNYRRGRKTTHVVYGEAMGILAGDGLLNYAFETALKAFDLIMQPDDIKIMGTHNTDKPGLAKRIACAAQVLSGKAGVYGMIGGQVVDMEQTSADINRERLDLMYHLKTGALIEASMMIGAILAGADTDEISRVEKIAGDIGLAFQIKDDILDVTGTPEILGKPIHSDEKNEKTTYVTLMDLESAHQEVLRISQRAIEEYLSLPCRNEFLNDLIIMLVNRKN